MAEEETFTAEQVAQQIRAMRDSVWVIDDTVDNNETLSEQHMDRIRANVGHLELMMGKDHIANAGDDLSDITAAIAKGKTALGE
jgi:uncharacterized protein with PhoU and TrkA domain